MDKILILNTIAIDWFDTSFRTLATDIVYATLPLIHMTFFFYKSKHPHLEFVFYSILYVSLLVINIAVAVGAPDKTNIITRTILWLAIVVGLIVSTTKYLKYRKS
ncbi:MAG: hypothetical protein LBK70_00820 [Clostridiales bacterium]|jgi:hypothetical protein|nr:hypothetical protein [Clostridiales bacterium]